MQVLGLTDLRPTHTAIIRALNSISSFRSLGSRNYSSPFGVHEQCEAARAEYYEEWRAVTCEEGGAWSGHFGLLRVLMCNAVVYVQIPSLLISFVLSFRRKVSYLIVRSGKVKEGKGSCTIGSAPRLSIDS
jgi:hypothetical protein